MNIKQKIFKTMWRKYGEDILIYIYQNQPVTFKNICKKFNKITDNQVRHIVSDMSSAGLIKSERELTNENPRGRAYIIDNDNLVISLLELPINEE